jgi:hypothetical protein
MWTLRGGGGMGGGGKHLNMTGRSWGFGGARAGCVCVLASTHMNEGAGISN